MKCSRCGKRMRPMLTDIPVFIHNALKTVIHVPAGQCPNCGAVSVHPMVRANAERFAYTGDDPTVDYAQCEEAETTVLIATQMLW
ncbi:MAG: hypothetical protein ABFC73_03675 [Clostridiaceae bacterium]